MVLNLHCQKNSTVSSFSKHFDFFEVLDAHSLFFRIVTDAVFGFSQAHIVELPPKLKAFQRGVILVFERRVFD